MNKYRSNSREKMLSLKNKILGILVSEKELSDNPEDESEFVAV